MAMGESCEVDDIEVVNASLDENEHNKIKTGQVVLSDGNQTHTELSACDPNKVNLVANDEDDYEDMMTPTDDEGITSLNHTQKIPISLIKAKDKASVSIHN